MLQTTRNLQGLHYPDNTFQGRICLQREISSFLGPRTQQVCLAPLFIHVLKFSGLEVCKMRLYLDKVSHLTIFHGLVVLNQRLIPHQENVKQRLFTAFGTSIFLLYAFGFNFKVIYSP